MKALGAIVGNATFVVGVAAFEAASGDLAVTKTYVSDVADPHAVAFAALLVVDGLGDLAALRLMMAVDGARWAVRTLAVAVACSVALGLVPADGGTSVVGRLHIALASVSFVATTVGFLILARRPSLPTPVRLLAVSSVGCLLALAVAMAMGSSARFLVEHALVWINQAFVVGFAWWTMSHHKP